jgi:penicillin-binding protein-related factor A (putative recombinase)
LPLTPGKQFEKSFEDSAKKDKIFIYRIKDSTSAFNPKCMTCPNSKTQFTVKNSCDSFLFKSPQLLPLEFKSTKSKSISLSDKIIRPQQIKSLTEWLEYEGIVAGFIFNFREVNNATYFLHIKDFNDYVANPDRKNKSSVPISYCDEVGIKIINKVLKTNYRYDIKEFIDQINNKYEVSNG